MRSLRTIIVVFLLVLHFTGCASPLHQATYYRYMEQGDNARAEGNWDVAEFAYSRALTNVDWGNLSLKEKSEALYNLGEVKQVLGKHDESAELLQQALAIDEELYGPDGFVTSYTLASLAITYYKQNRIDEGLKLLQRIEGIYQKHPDKFPQKFKKETSRLLNQYAEKLYTRGEESEAGRLEDFAASIIVKEN